MLTLSISGVNRSTLVVWESLRIENILTKQVDRCTFKILKYGARDYKPVVGRQIVVSDTGVTVFGGVIVRVTEDNDGFKLLGYTVECSDYTRILDQHLVADTYENMTVNAIIADLVATWAPVGFTVTQVDAPVTINYIQFKYIPVSEAIKQLADILGFDWYVDYSKDIYFKAPASDSAPVTIEDSNGSHVYESLVIRRDNSQMRNSIIVRGGEYLGTMFTTEMVADGEQVIFPLGYKYTDFGATLTGDPLSVGIDNIDNPDNYDALYNFNEKIIKFKEGDKPTLDSVLRVSGRPHLPVIIKVKDQTAIDAIFSAEDVGDGAYEYLVIDKSINSKAGARERAIAEIRAYGQTLSEGEFETETTGFKAGQTVQVLSTSRGLNENFIVNKVIAVMKSPDAMRYNISLITTKTMDFISIMKKLLLAEAQNIEIKAGEFLDLAEVADETIMVEDTFVAQALNYAVQFVLGPWAPTGTKRVFIFNGSPLG